MKLRLLTVLLACAAIAPAQKKAMTIDDFDYSAVMTSVQAIFGTQMNIGQGIQAMLVKRVAEGGKFTIVERKKIGAVMKEQDFSASNRVKQGSGARIGQIRGADLTLMGDIVVFGRDDRRTSAGVGAGVFGAGGGAIGGSKGDFKAVVVLDYRIVDEETSEVVGSGEARGESKRTSKGFGAAMFAGGVFAGGGVNMTSSNFGETIIGEATMDAVNKLAANINSADLTGGAGGRELDLDAKVADVSGSSITINAGTAAGLRVGQTFTIYHKGKEIKDPSTGEVLDVQTTPLGTLTIVGITSDAAYRSFRAPMGPSIYSPMAQRGGDPILFTYFYLAVRSAAGSPMQLTRSVAAALTALNRDLTMTFRPLATAVDDSLAQDRLVAMLAGFFGALALLLAGLGLYGVTSYAVNRRRTEIGIRMALGAAPRLVVRLVLVRVSMLVGLGLVAGGAISLWASAFVAPLVYGLGPRDPATLISSAIVLAAIGVLAGWVPAFRASRVDPAEVLRET